MSSPDDIGAAARDAAQVYGAEQYAAGATSRQPEVDALKAQETADVATIAGLRTTNAGLLAANLAIQAAFDAYKRTHPDTVRTPYVGAAMQSRTTDPRPLEQSAGRPLGVHVTYWNLNEIDQAVAMARSDIAAGRVPWLSMKLGVTWAQAAAGAVDVKVKDYRDKLAALDGEVWDVFHHEPQGDPDGTADDFRAMQDRLVPILDGAGNIRSWICLIAWNTYAGSPDHALAKWEPNVKVDLGMDFYNPFGTVKNGKTVSTWTELDKYANLIAQDAKDRGVDWAIRETGYTDSAATRDPAWFGRSFDTMADNEIQPGLALCYFNSSANSIGSWPLNTVKTPEFDAALNRSHPVA